VFRCCKCTSLRSAQGLIDVAGEMAVWLKKVFLAQSLASDLTRQVDEVERAVGEDGQRFGFPVHPGTHLESSSPSLEFVKAVMKVLSLDQVVTSECYVLRKSLLAQIHVQEFAEETKWEQPCNSLVLHSWFCTGCHR